MIPCFGFGDGNVRYKTNCLSNKVVLLAHFLSASTHDQDVFSFYSEERFCNGFEEVLTRYRQIIPSLKLAGVALTYYYLSRSFLIRLIKTYRIHVTGPTSFAPIIEMAMTIVEQSGGQYHVLLIIADGQVIL